MSVKIMSQVWENGPMQQAERFVLLALADFANDAGECWPSIDGIAKKTCLKERGVRQILRRLEESGWLATDVGGGRHGCNHYRINPAPHAPFSSVKPGTTCPPAPHAPRHMDAETRHMDAQNPAPHAPEPSRTINNHHNMVEGKKTTPKEPRQNLDEGFDEFWAVYPKKVAKPDALKNWRKAIKDGATASQIIEGARRYAASETVRNGYVKHPQGWLSSHRWEDEPAMPVSTAPVDQNSAWLRKVAGRN